MRGGEATRSGKRPLRSLTVHEKIDAIDRVHDGESKASVARDIGVPESTLRGWCKSEPKIRSMARNSSTPESEAHSPASSTGANLYTSNPGTSRSSEDEAPTIKRVKGADMPLPLISGVDNTENGDKRFDYPGLMALAGYRPENSSLLLQQLGMLSASSNNFIPMAPALNNLNAVGLVENGLQYTKSANTSATNNMRRSSIGAIAPSQMETVNKLAGRKSLPPAAEAPAVPLAASPNHQNPVAVSENKNGVVSKKMDDALWLWLLQQKNQLGQHAAQQTAQLCQDRSWFWQWYKHCGFPATPVETTPSGTNKSPNKCRAVVDTLVCSNNNENVVEDNKHSSSFDEGVEHGEKFFQWLEKTSNPSVTRYKVVELRYFLDNLKTSRKRTLAGIKRKRK